MTLVRLSRLERDHRVLIENDEQVSRRCYLNPSPSRCERANTFAALWVVVVDHVASSL